MRTNTRAALALIVIAGLCTAACAGGDDENFLAPMFAKFRHRVHGTVSKFDGAAKTFSVSDKAGREFSFGWDEKTIIDGMIGKGVTVTVRYRNEHGMKVATKVKGFGTPAAASPGTAPAAEKKQP